MSLTVSPNPEHRKGQRLMAIRKLGMVRAEITRIRRVLSQVDPLSFIAKNLRHELTFEQRVETVLIDHLAALEAAAQAHKEARSATS